MFFAEFSYENSLSPTASSFTFRHIVASTFINACGPAVVDYDDYMTTGRKRGGGRGGGGRPEMTLDVSRDAMGRV